MMISHETLSDNLSKAVPVLKTLRNSLSDAEFQTRLNRAIENGYQLILARENDRAVGRLGNRITYDLFWGKTQCIDDLVVRPEVRAPGTGGRLLETDKTRAKKLRCNHIRLCSGLARTNAHGFHTRCGLQKSSLQFAFALTEGER